MVKSISDILQGYINIIQSDNGYFQPIRFSDSQITEYTKNPDFLIRAYSSAGMCIRVKTDASKISFKYRLMPGSAIDMFGFDVFVDEKIYSHFCGKISEKSEGIFSVTLPEGYKDLCIYFPCLAKADIGNPEFTDATICLPIHEDRKLLFLGDSITQGYIGSFPSFGFPAIIARKMHAELLNQAIGGEMFHPEVFERECGWKPTHIISCYGTNEWANKSRKEFTSDCKKLFENLHNIYKDIPIAVVTPIWRANKDTRRGDNTFPFEDAGKIMGEVVNNYNHMFVIDGMKILPAIHELMEDDVLHPNDLGNVLYADSLYEAFPDSWK